MQRTMRDVCYRLSCVIALSWTVRAFLLPTRGIKSSNTALRSSGLTSVLFASTTSTTTTINERNDDDLDLILFGVGDLRTDDHLGLYRVLQQQQQKQRKSRAAAICILDDTTLANIPGVVAHTVDTVNILLAALDDLSKDLKERFNLPLHVMFPRTSECSVSTILSEIARNKSLVGQDGKLCVHVHDLGEVDNQMGYGPWAHLKTRDSLSLPSNLELKRWTTDLRSSPWDQLDNLPTLYTEYRDKYMSQRVIPPADMPLKGSLVGIDLPETLGGGSVSASNQALNAADLVEHLTKLLHLQAEQVQAETNTGLYMTHWGGIQPASVGCRAALEITQAYLGSPVQSDDEMWTQHPLYPGRSCRRNGRSLEHASMQWQLRSTGKTPAGAVENWMKGESIVRWAAAPLLLGTLSPRRVWHMADRYEQVNKKVFFQDPCKTLVEAREWHRLLAAHKIRTTYMYSAKNNNAAPTYKYWRYHGFLCRYAITEMASDATNNPKNGILLVHGFGASCAQWNKAMKALSSERIFDEGLALDLLGFGEAEKPAISYTAYLWDSMVGDFVKECALARHSWGAFVLGGNSIGGFTSMSAAASDCARLPENRILTVNSSGAPGTGKCAGLVLMNSAGPVFTKDELTDMLNQSTNYLQRASVAQITALDALPPCSPPPRPLTRVFGNALLAYLRPNIKSICKNLYPTDPSQVDDSLCEAILRDSLDPGAISVMMAGAKLPSPRSANELLRSDFRLGNNEHIDESTVHESSFEGPVLVAQGILDPLNDAADRMQRFGALREGITINPISAGHCPHDELPNEVASAIARWASTSLDLVSASKTGRAKMNSIN